MVDGSCGTLSELALAKRHGAVPVVQIGGWCVLDINGDEVSGVENVTTAAEADDLVLHAVRR